MNYPCDSSTCPDCVGGQCFGGGCDRNKRPTNWDAEDNKDVEEEQEPWE